MTHLKKICKNLLITLLFYSILRFLFYLFNYSHFKDAGGEEFLLGIRFDGSAIALINISIVFFQLIPIKVRKYLNFWYSLFIIANAVGFATQLIDIAYFPFTLRRSDADLITAQGMQHEMKSLWINFLGQYWYLVLIFVIMVFAFVKWTVIPDFSEKINKKFLLKYIPLSLLFVGILLLIARGGWQKKPLQIVDANYHTSSSKVPLVLNTPFAVMKSFGKNDRLKEYHFYKKDEIRTPYDVVYRPKKDSAFIPKNLVILILESFGKENIGYWQGTPYTPFLDSLIRQSRVFENSYANGKVSIASVPSVICGIPSWYKNNYIHSSYVFNNIESFPKLLRPKGYVSSFFHGAFNGSQNFDRFADIAAFDHYYGKNEYPYQGDDDGKWGIWDEPYLQYFNTMLTKQKEPFMATLFTLSSHNPYKVPEKYKDKFPKGTNVIHQSIRYTDWALKQFFVKAKKEKWYTNTLFVITADHTSQSFNSPNLIEKMKVPILFFDPSNLQLKGSSKKEMQHIDILPWVMDYLHFDKPFISFGNKRNNKNKFIVEFLNNEYWVIHNQYCYIYNLQVDLQKIIDLQTPNEKRKDISTKLKNKDSVTTAFRYLIQSFNNRNNANKMTYSKEFDH